MRIDTLTIVGVGLIGGSVGLAARQRGAARRVVGVGRHPDALERARRLGAVEEWSLDLEEAARRSDFLVFCTPVDRIADQVLQAGAVCPADAVLTDAGSTKGEIVRAVEARRPPRGAFVGSHPLAGSEKSGVEHARADLFDGRLTVVTKAPWTDAAALARATTFWEGLGSRVRVMDPWEHDRALALTSHLPHLLAAALAGVLPPPLYELTATGFRDTTRVAAGDPALWAAILDQNRAAVLEALGQLGARLGQFEGALRAGDVATLNALLTQGKKGRDALGS